MSDPHDLVTAFSKMSMDEKIEYLAGMSRMFLPELSIEEHRKRTRRIFEDAGMIEHLAPSSPAVSDGCPSGEPDETCCGDPDDDCLYPGPGGE